VNFSGSARKWLHSQPEPNLRIAREIITRRKALAGVRADLRDTNTAVYENGVVWGMRLALSYLSDRPGDISDTGAEGFISNVESADEMAAEDAAAERAERQKALAIACPVCVAEAAEPCRNTVTGLPGDFVHGGRVARWENRQPLLTTHAGEE
jgi:hypothetical protein